MYFILISDIELGFTLFTEAARTQLDIYTICAVNKNIL